MIVIYWGYSYIGGARAGVSPIMDWPAIVGASQFLAISMGYSGPRVNRCAWLVPNTFNDDGEPL